MSLQVIHKKIFEIRGQKVMLDFNLAELYEVETRRLNEQVKRNIDMFPEDFMFRLTANEWEFIQLKSAQGSERNPSSQFVMMDLPKTVPVNIYPMLLLNMVLQCRQVCLRAKKPLT